MLVTQCNTTHTIVAMRIRRSAKTNLNWWRDAKTSRKGILSVWKASVTQRDERSKGREVIFWSRKDRVTRDAIYERALVRVSTPTFRYYKVRNSLIAQIFGNFMNLTGKMLIYSNLRFKLTAFPTTPIVGSVTQHIYVSKLIKLELLQFSSRKTF